MTKVIKKKTVSARITKELFDQIKENKIKVSTVINNALADCVEKKPSMSREEYLALTTKGARD